MQLLNIANDAFGTDRYYQTGVGHKNNNNWAWVDKTFSHEKGMSPLGGTDHAPSQIRANYQQMDNTNAIDFTEVVGFKIHLIDQEIQNSYRVRTDKPAPRMDEINYRLREAGMGYQFESGRLARVDSQFIHHEVVKPALSLLSKPNFQGAQQEFLKAHSHYRASQNKEAVAMAANSLVIGI
jgi:hypothetical protein